MERRLDKIPHLIEIVVGAFPHLNLVSTVQTAIRQVETFLHVGPGNAIVSSNRKLLVLIARRTCPNLHLGAVCSRTTSNIEALVFVDSQGRTIRNPRLRIRLVTRFNDDRSTVGIARGREAGRRALAGVNDASSRGRITRSCACAPVNNLPFLISTTSASPNLCNIAVSEGTTGVVQAATTSAYLNGIAGGDPLLILVPRIASVDLHLGPVIEIAVSQIQAFIAKDPEIETLDSP